MLEGIEPWGEKRADYRAARIVEAICHSQGAKMEFRDILKMFDFDPKPPDEECDEEVLESAAQIQ